MRSCGASKMAWSATVSSTTPRPAPRWPPVTETASITSARSSSATCRSSSRDKCLEVAGRWRWYRAGASAAFRSRPILRRRRPQYSSQRDVERRGCAKQPSSAARRRSAGLGVEAVVGADRRGRARSRCGWPAAPSSVVLSRSPRPRRAREKCRLENATGSTRISATCSMSGAISSTGAALEGRSSASAAVWARSAVATRGWATRWSPRPRSCSNRPWSAPTAAGVAERGGLDLRLVERRRRRGAGSAAVVSRSMIISSARWAPGSGVMVGT